MFVLQQFSGWLSIDDPYQKAHAPYTLRSSAIFACFGDLLSSIVDVSGGQSLNLSAFPKAFKAITTFWVNLLYEVTWSSKRAFKIEGLTKACPTIADTAKLFVALLIQPDYWLIECWSVRKWAKDLQSNTHALFGRGCRWTTNLKTAVDTWAIWVIPCTRVQAIR